MHINVTPEPPEHTKSGNVPRPDRWLGALGSQELLLDLTHHVALNLYHASDPALTYATVLVPMLDTLIERLTALRREMQETLDQEQEREQALSGEGA